MQNSSNLLKLSLTLSFQGKVHNLVGELDLDDLLTKTSSLPPLHDWIARVNNIDSYSYLFEVLQSEEIIIEEATGLAADFVENNQFDAEGFIAAWRQNQALTKLNAIAQNHLGESLESNAKLKAALLEAFDYGYEQGQKNI